MAYALRHGAVSKRAGTPKPTSYCDSAARILSPESQSLWQLRAGSAVTASAATRELLGLLYTRKAIGEG